MSEKTTVTVDCGLTIPEGTEKVYEGQHLRLVAGIDCSGTLIFRNCIIESCPSKDSQDSKKRACKPGCININTEGKLEMDGCEVIHPGKGFLSGWDIVIKSTSFLLAPGSDAVIAAHGEARFDGCTFEEETGDNASTSAGQLMGYSSTSLNNCTFKNITSKIDIGDVVGCSFTGCLYIDGSEIRDSTFTDCKDIIANSGYIRNCNFIHVNSVQALAADVDSCHFRRIENDSEYGGCIYIEDCKITHCSFDDVELRNGSYLIEGVGDTCVEYCQFTNCRTTRDDLEICHSEIETGKLRKRKVEVDILRDDTCTGLDQIERLQ